MRPVLVCVLASGCFSDGTGSVVYTEAITGHVMVVDVASGTQTPVDLGFFGDVSIAPDGQHVAYLGLDMFPRVTDLQGNVTRLPTTGGCGGAPLVWGPGNTLAYCISSTTGIPQFGFMPGIGGAVRVLQSPVIATSHDGTRLAYFELTDPNTTSDGRLVIEDIGGANRQVLVPSLEILSLAFMPDDRGLVVGTVRPPTQTQTSALHIETIATAGGDGLVDLGTGTLPVTVTGGSLFSPDGSEVLAFQGGALVALDLASGDTRPFALVDPNQSQVQVAFVARDKVIYSRIDSFFMGDVGGVSQASVRIADGNTEKVLVSSDGSSQCTLTSVATAHGLASLQCSVPSIIDFDGTLVTSRNSALALGISGDGEGMVTMNQTGAVEYVARNGNVKLLATAMVADGSTSLSGPFAAYAP